MNLEKKVLAMLIPLVLASTLIAQSNGANGSRISMPVVNEDQGRACMVVRSALTLLNGDQTSVPEPRQYSVFLGDGWSSNRTQARKNDLTNLFANPGVVDPGALSKLGWNNIYGTKLSGEHLLAEASPISDLRIQSILTSVVRRDAMLTAPADYVYVIYLEPGLTPRLGENVGIKHHLSYYNAVNIAGSRLRYVVVSYDSNSKTMVSNALNGLIALVFQPTCS